MHLWLEGGAGDGARGDGDLGVTRCCLRVERCKHNPLAFPFLPFRAHFHTGWALEKLRALDTWGMSNAGDLGLGLKDPWIDGWTDRHLPSPNLRVGPSSTSLEWHHSREVPGASCCLQKGLKGLLKVKILLFLDAFPRGWSRPRLELLKFSVLCLFN